MTAGNANPPPLSFPPPPPPLLPSFLIFGTAALTHVRRKPGTRRNSKAAHFSARPPVAVEGNHARLECRAYPRLHRLRPAAATTAAYACTFFPHRAPRSWGAQNPEVHRQRRVEGSSFGGGSDCLGGGSDCLGVGEGVTAPLGSRGGRCR